MNPTNHSSNDGDDRLWRIASKRVAFRKGLYLYCVFNAFFWLIWYFTSHHQISLTNSEIPWPIYPLLGWGLGIAIQYYNLPSPSGKDPVTTEYEKLKREKKID